jgi:hypothetical protein
VPSVKFILIQTKWWPPEVVQMLLGRFAAVGSSKGCQMLNVALSWCPWVVYEDSQRGNESARKVVPLTASIG